MSRRTPLLTRLRKRKSWANGVDSRIQGGRQYLIECDGDLQMAEAVYEWYGIAFFNGEKCQLDEVTAVWAVSR